jgi:hypothetical protein
MARAAEGDLLPQRGLRIRLTPYRPSSLPREIYQLFLLAAIARLGVSVAQVVKL